jgi:hypothetical protein
MKAFFIGVLFLISVGIILGIGVLFFPLFVVLGLFFQCVIIIGFCIFVIWLLGKIVIFVWERLKHKKGPADSFKNHA